MNKSYLIGIATMFIGYILFAKYQNMISVIFIGIGFVFILTSYGKK